MARTKLQIIQDNLETIGSYVNYSSDKNKLSDEFTTFETISSTISSSISSLIFDCNDVIDNLDDEANNIINNFMNSLSDSVIKIDNQLENFNAINTVSTAICAATEIADAVSFVRTIQSEFNGLETQLNEIKETLNNINQVLSQNKFVTSVYFELSSGEFYYDRTNVYQDIKEPHNFIVGSYAEYISEDEDEENQEIENSNEN